MSTESRQPLAVGVSPPASAYLDALRAVAANLVVVAHVLLRYFPDQHAYRGGSAAVVIFFLLSGFLITQSMLGSASRPGLQFPGFLADRVARIMTPFVPALIVVVLLNLFVINSHHGQPGLNTGVVAFLGNLTMLMDYPLFQLLKLAHVDMWWRIRPYNTAEPFWTVAVEFWLYIAVGLFFFCVLFGERIRRWYAWVLAAVSVPVLLWNAAAGSGESLSLVWLMGAMAGYLIARVQGSTTARWKVLPLCIVVAGCLALAGRINTAGFDPYNLQIAVLMAIIMFGVLLALNRIERIPNWLGAPVRFLASYSYSLYLTHNTVLVVVFEHTQSLPKPVSIAIGVVAAQFIAWLGYLAFERHYRKVAWWLRPIFTRLLAPPAGSSVPPRHALEGLTIPNR